MLGSKPFRKELEVSCMVLYVTSGLSFQGRWVKGRLIEKSLGVFSRLACTGFHNLARACKAEEITPVSQDSCLKVQLSSWHL